MPGIAIDRLKAERAEANIRRRVEREAITNAVETKLRTEKVRSEAANDLRSLHAMAADAGLPAACLSEVIAKGLTGDAAKAEIGCMVEKRAAKRFQRLGGGGLVR